MGRGDVVMPKQLYLDSRDLIDLVARALPMSVTEFARVLREKDWAVVYSYANVCETTLPTDLHETARRARSLLSLPHSFIRSMNAIHCMELAECIRVLDVQMEPRPIDPFVTHWFETFLYPRQDRQMSHLARLGFEQQVLAMVEKNPDVCRNLANQTAEVQRAVERDRTVTDAVRRNRERFEGGLVSRLMGCHLKPPAVGMKSFARWLREEPARGPSWTLFNEVYLQFAVNVTDAVDDGDTNDWSHVSALPYVDAVTLDRRTAGYTRAAATNLARRVPSCNYAPKIFASAANWLSSV